ncbi:SDR family NAD(P)-dependent oxidoreductase [Georgenia sp. AZ-5]|uniref:SDR family NAD(P)-dependent oxidoreductase n=1 Tax=Georgenia sp. AZ-5 TaxID=3367526 RepID=UPI0037547DEF
MGGTPHHGRKLQDKVTLVTGGGSRIGEATCLKFSREGAKVAVVDRDRDHAAAQAVAATTEAQGGVALAITADIARATGVESAVTDTIAAFGRLDAAVNNAGVPGASNKGRRSRR